MTGKHWGKADFFRHPITGEWSCNDCRAPMPNNLKVHECPEGKARRAREKKAADK